jgi:hypothetical protein
MLKALLFIALLCLGSPPTEYKLVTTLASSADLMTSDNLGNLYLASEETLEKHLRDGSLQYKYSDLTLGKITSIDASNSLRVTLFYRDLSQVVILDNTLSPQSDAVALDQLGYSQVTQVCTSNNNHLWLYDRTAFSLIRVDRHLEAVTTTNYLNQILGKDLDPNFMVEYNNWLYLNDPKIGILVFDNFGTYSKTIPITNLTSFQVLDDGLYYVLNARLMKYDFRALMESEVVLPEQGFEGVQLQKNRLFIRQHAGLSIYSF